MTPAPRPRGAAGLRAAGASPADVLRSLADAVRAGRVPLTLAVEHTATGVDPVAAAWAACRCDFAMLAVLAATGLPVPSTPGLAHALHPRVDGSCPRCADALRAGITVTLADVLAAREVARG